MKISEFNNKYTNVKLCYVWPCHVVLNDMTTPPGALPRMKEADWFYFTPTIPVHYWDRHKVEDEFNALEVPRHFIKYAEKVKDKPACHGFVNIGFKEKPAN